MAEDKATHRNASPLVTDILTLLNAREAALMGELAQLRDYRRTFEPNGPTADAPVESAQDATPPARSRGRHKFTPAQRRAASKRMKAVWSARKAKS